MNRKNETVLEGVATGSRATGEIGFAGSLLRGAGIVLSASAFVAICAHVSIPLWFTPVPITLQPFAVLLLGLLLSPQIAAATMVMYLTEGAIGMPVFTPHGPGGVAQLLGPTGGYLVSYPVVAPMVSWLWRRGTRNFVTGLWSAGIGSLVTLTLGALWFAIVTHTPPSTVLGQAVLPFLPGDAIKVCAAAALGASIAGTIRKHRATR